MNSVKKFFVCFFMVQCFKTVPCKPLFKGLSFKKNYEMEISAIPFNKHISIIKEKWFPFKMFSVKHDIAKREVVEDPVDDNLYSVNEVTYDNEENSINTEGETIAKTVPVIENIQSVHIKPVLETENLANGIIHTSSVIPINPSIIIAPSLHTTGTAVQPAAVVPLDPVMINLENIEVQPMPPVDAITPIQPMHTHIDLPSEKILEETVSKMHTDISSVVPLNTLVASPVQEMDLPLPVDVKIEGPVIETPKVIEEIKVQPIDEPEPVIVPVVEPAVVAPVMEPPAVAPVIEPPVIEPIPVPTDAPGKTGPVGLLMRGTRFVLYFGSVMLQLLSQMISGGPPNLNHLTEPLAL